MQKEPASHLLMLPHKVLPKDKYLQLYLLFSCYQLDLLNLNEQQRRAVEAFQGGYISIGKLAEEMGMRVWHLQKWMEEHDIPQNSTYSEDDVKHA